MHFSFEIPNGKPPSLYENLPVHRLFKTIVTSPKKNAVLTKAFTKTLNMFKGTSIGYLRIFYLLLKKKT